LRVEAEIPDEQHRRLEALMEEAGIKTMKDLLNNALTLLEWSLKETRSGRIIASVDESNRQYKQLGMPILERKGN
jgi:hypothetical protein